MTDSSSRPATFAIDAQKIRSDLLNIDHPVGRSKARFFLGWGFKPDTPTVFTAALLAHARLSPLIEVVPFAWGTKFVFEGPLKAPFGVTPVVRTIWTTRPNSDAATLSSAYPV